MLLVSFYHHQFQVHCASYIKNFSVFCISKTGVDNLLVNKSGHSNVSGNENVNPISRSKISNTIK